MPKTVRKNFPVQGMGCAACVARVQGTIRSQKGVSDCNVSLASNSAQVDYDPKVITAADIRKAVQEAGYDLIIVNDGESDEDAEDEADRLRDDYYRSLKADASAAIFLSLLIMSLGMGFKDFPFKGYVLLALTTPVLFWCGRRFIVTAWKQACHFSAGMDTLVALSTLISYFFSLFNLLFPQVWTSRGLTPHLYFESSAMIVAFILLGRVLEEKAKRGTTASIRELIGLQPKSVDLSPGDEFTVRPGDRIPADGIVVRGESYVDESMLTGEPVPNRKSKGDKIFAGTINQKGSFEAKAEKVGRDTMLSSIIAMVRDAQGSKARIQETVDKVAAVFVPVIIAVSVVTLLCWILLDPADGLTRGLMAMVTVLVIACPCSLGLATPTALTVGIGTGARHGILIKDADSLQVAEKIDTVVLDKTGTITEGHPKVVAERWLEHGDEGILLAMELRSEHPLAAAVVAHLHSMNMSVQAAALDSFEAVPGAGIKAMSGGNEYFAGKPVNMSTEASAWVADGCTVISFSTGDRTLAEFAITDEVKESSAEAVARLRCLGVETVMLTGDNEASARKVAGKVGIGRVEAGMLPGDKAIFIKRLQERGHRVAMVGDGINDSAALAQADLSVAMGRGSDIAIDTAMVTVVSSDLAKLSQMIALSRRTVKVIRQNLFWAFFYNVLAVPVAAGVLYPVNGFLLNPMVAAACMALSSVCVVTNSLRLRRFADK
ncbi:MAG: heavy metal translocating P-type ATPase [Bacteroidales bacterium]|nr:heavy metal translocating P-type ATPase [Bacteroidales bacterium]